MNNLEVALVNYLCPICGKVAEEAIVMNSLLTKEMAENVNKLHKKAIGYANKACEECAECKNKVLFLIGVDPNKSDFKQMETIYRTGQILGIDKNSDLVKHIEQNSCIITLEDDTQLCFVEEELIESLINKQ